MRTAGARLVGRFVFGRHRGRTRSTCDAVALTFLFRNARGVAGPPERFNPNRPGHGQNAVSGGRRLDSL